MNFGQALELLKQGKRLARAGWNGKGLWVRLIQSNIPSQSVSLKIDGAASTGAALHTYLNPFFVIDNPNGGCNTWVPSVSDCLAEDWEEVA